MWQMANKEKQLVQIQSNYITANYSNLYYFQNHHYIRFMSFMDKTNKAKKQNIQSGTTNTLKSTNIQQTQGLEYLHMMKD